MPGGRYEFKPFRYSSHFWIAEVVRRERKSAKILDVGTSSGYLGKILSEEGHKLTGLEGNAEEAQQARVYYERFHSADAENFDFAYRQEFDFILFGDVLEHLRDPVSVLRRCIPALKRGGKIIISVPNVANLLIRLSLLFGRFDYTERGILDRTHLRFFTLRSLKRMMADVPCKVLEVMATPLPVQLVLPFTKGKLFVPFHEAQYGLTRLWKRLFAYQFVVVAAPLGVLSGPGSEETNRVEGVASAK